MFIYLFLLNNISVFIDCIGLSVASGSFVAVFALAVAHRAPECWFNSLVHADLVAQTHGILVPSLRIEPMSPQGIGRQILFFFFFSLLRSILPRKLKI